MSAINLFLLRNGFSLASNPCISPDFCLDFPSLHAAVSNGVARQHTLSELRLPQGQVTLVEDARGDHGWLLKPTAGARSESILQGGLPLENGSWLFPASFENLVRLKNAVLEANPSSTVFPSTGGRLGKSTIGVGARFTTLHWPAVEWAMAQLGIGLTANQNSIPRELVYDVDAMLEGRLDSVPFPFLGANVPEGHQGQSVEGMSHGAILSKLKTGFHRRGIEWSFNADHQPIGGKFDTREDALVKGCLFASYITFDLSPELAQTRVPEDPRACADWVRGNVEASLLAKVRARVAAAGLELANEAFDRLVCLVWPALRKMLVRDTKYRAVREVAFTTEKGRTFLRELSIDELPGLTAPETTAAMLAFCEVLGMPIHFVAPAFGFQKNLPYPDNQALRALIERQWAVCCQFGSSLGVHSGSGKSAENYRVIGEVTGSCLEIKTSGRYTYEMGCALAESRQGPDQELWHDWYTFTLDLATQSAFSKDLTERSAARTYIERSFPAAELPANLFETSELCRSHLAALPPSPEYPVFFEYNFLYVLAAGGRADKGALGDHGPEGYRQRARFYAISDEARLHYSKRVAAYLVFVAEAAGLAPQATCASARAKLAAYTRHEDLLASIAP